MWMRALSILALLGCGLHRARSDSASAAFSEAAGLRQSTIQQNDSRIFGIWEVRRLDLTTMPRSTTERELVLTSA